MAPCFFSYFGGAVHVKGVFSNCLQNNKNKAERDKAILGPLVSYSSFFPPNSSLTKFVPKRISHIFFETYMVQIDVIGGLMRALLHSLKN